MINCLVDLKEINKEYKNNKNKLKVIEVNSGNLKM